MNELKLFEKLNCRLTLIIATTIFGCLSINNAIAHDHASVLFQPPSENQQPEETEGAASRHLGECAANSLSSQSAVGDRSNLTAIVPENNHGLTTAQRPNFWVYFPETLTKRAILSIKEKGKNPHWQQQVDLSGEAGITKIELLDNAPALENNKQYQWAVILVCGDRPSPNDPVVTAWIERVESTSDIDSTQGLEKASAYAQQGIWYDALNVLIDERSTMADWNNHWSKYLQSGGLNHVANEPIISDFSLVK